MNEELAELHEKYKKRIEEELGIKVESKKPVYSREYQQFRKEITPPHLTLYEKLCKISEGLMKIKPNKKKEAALQAKAGVAHQQAEIDLGSCLDHGLHARLGGEVCLDNTHVNAMRVHELVRELLEPNATTCGDDEMDALSSKKPTAVYKKNKMKPIAFCESS